MAHKTVGVVLSSGLLVGVAAALYPAAVGSLTPGSIEPDKGGQAVRVSHRNQTVVDCRHVASPPSCTGQLLEGDTGTVVSFVRTDVKPSSLRLVLPHQQGTQEQVATLPAGKWLVDWSGAPKPEKLDVRGDGRVDISLATVSGACVQSGDRCALVSGVRQRRIRVSRAE